MPLESATYLSQLDATQPLGTDPIASADDHIRLIKQVAKATLPNLTGPVTATQNDLNTRLVPSGAILMWSGSIASIPTNWYLCNGQNGTPNLMDRFIVGAGSGYGVGAIGGSVTAGTSAAGAHSHTTDVQGSHAHGGGTTYTALSIDQMPPHQHATGWGEAQNGPYGSAGGGIAGSGDTDGDNQNFLTSSTGGGQGHNHGIYSDGSHSHNVYGVGDHSHAVDTRSPYYALAYIMKG